MSNEVNTEQILQAITELSQQINQTEKNLNDKIGSVEERLNQTEKNLNEKIGDVEGRLDQKITKNADKIDNMDAKFSILSDSLLYTQAEMKQLKDAQ